MAATAVAPQIKIPPALQAANDKLALVLGHNPFARVFEKASKILAVREWLVNEEVMKYVVQLKGTASGFKTDENDKNQYTTKELAAAVTEALVNGFDLCGNEFNIIRGNFYGALNGYKRKCQQFEDGAIKMLGLEMEEGDITTNGNIAKVPLTVKYRYTVKDGGEVKDSSMVRTIQIKTFSTDTPDLWIGKASRRMYKKLFERLSGIDFGDDVEAEPTAGTQSSTMPMGETSLKKAAAAQPSPQKPAGDNPSAATDAAFTEVLAAKAKPIPEEASGKKVAERQVIPAEPQPTPPIPTEEPPAPAAAQAMPDFPDKF